LLLSEPSDFALYRDLLAERLKLHGVVGSAYCLMPNHVHLLLTPTRPDVAGAAASLSRSVGEAHRRYTAIVNARAHHGPLVSGKVRLRLDGRGAWVGGCPLSRVQAGAGGACERPEDWPWSSVAAHLRGRDDGCVDVSKVLEVAPHFADLLEPSSGDDAPAASFESLGGAARPLGDGAFLARAETLLGRSLAPRRPGRKPRAARKRKQGAV
jgi:putative transposase